MKRVFFDITNLRVYLENGHRLSGIQRVTVMLIEYTARQIGGNKVFLSFHDAETDAYYTIAYTSVGTVLSTDILNAALHKKQSIIHARPTLERYSRKPVKRALHTAIRNLNAALRNHEHFRKRRSTLEAWQASVNFTSGDPRPTLEKYSRKPVKRALHTAIRNLNAALRNRRHFEKRKSTLEAWRASANAASRNIAPKKSKMPFQDFFQIAEPGDHIILADAAWSLPLVYMKKARLHGVSCHLLVHDLIQIRAPELIGSTEQSFIFHDWLLQTMSFVDSYLANSAATATDLQEFLKTYGGKQRIDVVPLATAGIPVNGAHRSQHPLAEHVNEDVYPQLAKWGHIDDKIRSLTKRPYVLCVGTMEVRKNMWGLAQAWDRLRYRDDIELPRLVFVGNQGWLNHDFDRMMDKTGSLYGWIEQVFGPSDEELEFLYQNCLFTAMPSFFEGWGLPVGESLSYGKTAVVSRTSSLPEVGGDLVLYFDPHSISSITNAVFRMLSEEGLREALEEKISATELRGWDNVAGDILSALR